MHVDATNQKVLGLLGRALSLELSAVQLYSTQSRLVAGWGLDKAAARLREESLEEMQHVERIIARMLSKGAAPNASQLRPVKLGSDLLTLLRINQQFEMELVSLYQQAIDTCRQTGDGNDLLFFSELLNEEQQHASDLSAWIAEIEDNTASRPAQNRGGRSRMVW